jgi:rod shape-determining protein MreC
LAFTIISLVLIFGNQRFHWVDWLESNLFVLATPFYWVANLPNQVSDWSSETLVSRETLQEDNRHLNAEALLLKGKVQKLASLEAENVRLRELLNSSTLVEETVVVAELISVNPDPLKHQIVVNKGSKHGVYVGQPVIDALGLMGQIIEAGTNLSRVLLITDVTHAIPVQVNRNGVRSIVEGTGLLHELQLRYVAATTDIKEGDLLVSSGLGRRFPQGYPVAVVTEVTIDPGQPFAIVKASPSAQLNRSRHVLLVFTRDNSPSDDGEWGAIAE